MSDKYAKTVRKLDGTYETRVHTDYGQKIGNAAGEAAGNIIYELFAFMFKTKTSSGIILGFLGFLILIFGSSGGAKFWGVVLFFGGIGLVVWAYVQRSQAKAEAERVAAAERYQQQEARRRAEKLARSHSVPPATPIVSLNHGEEELTRFWTREGDKALLTNKRLVFERTGGGVSILPISDIRSVNGYKEAEDDFNAWIEIPTSSSPKERINFSSNAEAGRVLERLTAAMLGTA